MTTTPTARDLERAVLAPHYFARSFEPRFNRRWPHVKMLAREISIRLSKRAKGEQPRHLIVEMPPRHGKSELGTIWTPAWALNNDPKLRVGIAAYGSRLARAFGRSIRNRVVEHEKHLRVRIADDSAAADEWSTTEGGGVFATGVGGAATGKGFDLLIIDDPVKNWKDAYSALKRESTWDWFTSTAYTRLEPNGLCVIILTRWHADDLAGRILADPDISPHFDEIKLPAIAEDKDPLGREVGAALCADRYPIDRLETVKRIVGPFVWNALYQQRPSPKGGGMFAADAWQLYDTPPEKFDRIIASWDMAFKETATSDFVVGQVWGQVGASAYLLEQVRDRMGFAKTKDALRAQVDRWRGRGLGAVYIEDKANGPAVIDALRPEVPGLVPVEPDGSKEARAAAVSPFVAAGNVHLPRWQSWVQDFIAEHEAFPAGDHDDQVDATSQALRQLYLSGAPTGSLATEDGLESPSRWGSLG